MAALTESGLRNLSYGDRDSVGFFQMRLGIWDQGAYAGYPSNPELQIQWFIDHAVAVKSQYPGLADNPNSWGEWVANVEQPAAQYRYRYQLAALHRTGAAARRRPDVGARRRRRPRRRSPPPVPIGQAALKVAMRFTGGGQPGSSLDTGPTSAEMVQYAYSQQGVQVPKVAAQQFDIGIPVSEQHLKPGDAVFFTERDGYVDHVGLYVGNGRFVSSARAAAASGSPRSPTRHSRATTSAPGATPLRRSATPTATRAPCPRSARADQRSSLTCGLALKRMSSSARS